MPSALLVAIFASGIAAIALPFVMYTILARKLALQWKMFWIGVLTFVVFQILLRLPWQVPLNTYAVNQGWDTGWAMVAFGLISAVTAGLFEETGRYLVYRYVVKEPSVDDGVSLGLGHGGVESIVIVGFSVISLGISLLLYVNGAIPPEQEALVGPSMDNLLQTPWYVQLVVVYERVLAITLHIAMSLLVYVAYARKAFIYFWAALGLHVVIDSVAVVARGQLLIAEGLLTVTALLALIWMVRLVRREKAAVA